MVIALFAVADRSADGEIPEVLVDMVSETNSSESFSQGANV